MIAFTFDVELPTVEVQSPGQTALSSWSRTIIGGSILKQPIAELADFAACSNARW